MGMFDWVDVTVRCPQCQSVVDGFQRKDGPCELLTLPLERVDHLYAKCKNPICCLWIDFHRQYPDVDEVLPGFDMTTRQGFKDKSAGKEQVKEEENAKTSG